MTNKQYSVITDIIASLNATKSVSGIQYIGEYPDDISVIGQRFPACIVEDGNETYDLVAGNVYHCDMEVKVHLYAQIITSKTKMKNLLDLQAYINDAILEDLTCGGYAVNIKLTEIPKDTIQSSQGMQISERILTYTVEIHDTRV